MTQVVIENPILNSPFVEPTQHWKFGEEGITNEVVHERRPSSYFKPVPAAKRQGGQLPFETEWTKDRIEDSKHINRIREKVSIWRRGGHRGTTRTTASLLEYWTREDRERKLFFCQIEALETAIYIAEVANKAGDTWIENEIREANERANPDLFRIAFKMATGSGKTVVMGMLIAWQVLNKLANPKDARFSDSFLIVTPGLTIRDRLRVLLRAASARSSARRASVFGCASLISCAIDSTNSLRSSAITSSRSRRRDSFTSQVVVGKPLARLRLQQRMPLAWS